MNDLKLANCLRFLAIDAIEKANSGHPGMPMGIADVASILFREFLSFSPANPKWSNRDRFVLSAGHGSMLLYGLLYLTGYEDISIDDIKNFRQLHSKCAGHPELGEFAGIETTTGPLGQGIANAVGMAISEKMLAARFGKEVFNHKIYAMVGDGCLMEGISQEALSIAGHLNLNNLVVLWDNNSISIDGKTSIATSENMRLRFDSLGFEVIAIDGHNFSEIRLALSQAQTALKPVLIDCKTTIGFGSPNKGGSNKVHGSPLGSEETLQTKKNLDWNFAPFEIPENLLQIWRNSAKKNETKYQNWQQNFDKLESSQKLEFEAQINKIFPHNFFQKLAEFKTNLLQEKSTKTSSQATRKSSQITLEFLTHELKALIGGSADLTDSVLTKTTALKSICATDFSGRYLHYGVREHAMAAIMNGLALHGNFIPFGGTFLVFSDYLKPALRLSALMKLQVIYILTHDSIGLGEDGPTHQPIEHLAMLRSIPNLLTLRPCDDEEVVATYEIALTSLNSPSAIVLSRQSLPFIAKPKFTISGLNIENSASLGAYIVFEPEFSETESKKTFLDPSKTYVDAIIFASGSEVSIALNAKDLLAARNIKARVVSVLSFELFFAQPQAYRNFICGKNQKDKKVIRAAIEAGVRFGWDRLIGDDGVFIGMNSFGASGKAEDLFQNFKITAENLAEKISSELQK